MGGTKEDSKGGIGIKPLRQMAKVGTGQASLCDVRCLIGGL